MTAFKVLYLLAMIAVVVGVDFLFLRHLFWGLRLAVNVGIVAVFVVGYFLLINRL